MKTPTPLIIVGILVGSASQMAVHANAGDLDAESVPRDSTTYFNRGIGRLSDGGIPEECLLCLRESDPPGRRGTEQKPLRFAPNSGRPIWETHQTSLQAEISRQEENETFNLVAFLTEKTQLLIGAHHPKKLISARVREQRALELPSRDLTLGLRISGQNAPRFIFKDPSPDQEKAILEQLVLPISIGIFSDHPKTLAPPQYYFELLRNQARITDLANLLRQPESWVREIAICLAEELWK